MPGNRQVPDRFVILAVPRSGSNLLCTLLNSHPDVVCHHEVFNPEGIFYALDFREMSPGLGSRNDRDREPLEFLARLWRHDWGVSHVGFKMTRGQDEQVLAAVLEEPGVRKILLRRSNVLRTYVSELIAQQTGRWEVYRVTELPVDRPRLRVEAEAFFAHAQLNEVYYTQLEDVLTRSGQAWLATDYENLFSSSEQRRLLRFLGVAHDCAALEPQSVRQNPEPLRHLIDNYDELAQALGGTDFAPLLETEETFAHDQIPGNA